MQSQFQLGLELTNILTPITSAVTALGSVGVARAIQQSGSDALTELELASFVGRNRIDDGLQYYFRQIVGKSSQSTLSRYLDIALDGGGGPTVQTALQNPELLSMVTQLSMLCSVHEETTLAQAMIEAIQRNLIELKADLTRVPHYPSLCGTLRVCKSESAKFQWSHLFDAVESKIAIKFGEDPTRSGELADDALKVLRRTSIANRSLSFPVLQILLLSLHSLQHHPDERLLNIECTNGITTVIVWCYHVLGLNVQLSILGKDIKFGNPDSTVFIRESSFAESKVSLLHPNSDQGPLFSLISGEGEPRIAPDLRARAKGYGLRLITRLGYTDEALEQSIHWVIYQSLRVLQLRAEASRQVVPMFMNSSSEMPQGTSKWSDHELFGLTEENVMRAGAFLFNREQNEIWRIKNNPHRPPRPRIHIFDLSVLVVLLLSIARVEAEDLDTCGDLPLSTQYQQHFRNDPNLQSFIAEQLEKVEIGLTRAFDVLMCFLQGPEFRAGMNKSTILVSACGWSLYFNSVSCLDPAEYFGSSLRIVRGVPTRNDVRRSRVVDGPTQLYYSTSEPSVLETEWKARASFYPGVSIARRLRAFAGYQEPDAFQITQSYEWQFKGEAPQRYLLGFRDMINSCLQFSIFQPCYCRRRRLKFQEIAESYLRHDDLQSKEASGGESNVHRTFFGFEGSEPFVFTDLETSARLSESGKSFKECIFAAQTGPRDRPTSEIWLFHVSDDPAARWMEFCALYPGVARTCDRNYRLLLRGPDTCLRCAWEAVMSDLGQTPTNDPQIEHEYNVTYTLL